MTPEPKNFAGSLRDLANGIANDLMPDELDVLHKAADELERLSAPEPPKPQSRTWWIVIDDDGHTQYACDWREGAHEHINDALMDGDEEAKGWKVVTAYSDSVPAPAYRERGEPRW